MIDDEGNGSCQSFKAFEQISEETWKEKKKLIEIIEPIAHKNTSNYDCLSQ